MTTIVCIKQGAKYGPEYVERLVAGLTRHTKQRFDFVCFTDNREGLDSIDCQPLHESLDGWWNKLWLFRDAAKIATDQLVAIDLDVVIAGNIDWLLDYRGRFLIAQDFYNKDQHYNGGLWSLQPSEHTRVWDMFDIQRERVYRDYYSDQEWITAVIPHADIIQQAYPGKLLSYKADGLAGTPVRGSIIAFHGEPKPHQLNPRNPYRLLWEEQ